MAPQCLQDKVQGLLRESSLFLTAFFLPTSHPTTCFSLCSGCKDTSFCKCHIFHSPGLCLPVLHGTHLDLLGNARQGDPLFSLLGHDCAPMRAPLRLNYFFLEPEIASYSHRVLPAPTQNKHTWNTTSRKVKNTFRLLCSFPQSWKNLLIQIKNASQRAGIYVFTK